MASRDLKMSKQGDWWQQETSNINDSSET